MMFVRLNAVCLCARKFHRSNLLTLIFLADQVFSELLEPGSH
jgi:hypothetical protein